MNIGGGVQGDLLLTPHPKDHHLSNSLFFPSPEPHAQPGHGHSISKSRDLVQCMKNYSGAVICRWIYWGKGGVKRASRSGPLPFRISVSALAHRRFMKFTIAVVKICSGPIPILIFFGSDRTLRQLPPLSGTPVYASHIFVAFSHPYSKVCGGTLIGKTESAALWGNFSMGRKKLIPRVILRGFFSFQEIYAIYCCYCSNFMWAYSHFITLLALGAPIEHWG